MMMKKLLKFVLVSGLLSTLIYANTCAKWMPIPMDDGLVTVVPIYPDNIKESDLDCDGIVNRLDDDLDGDGIKNTNDMFPRDGSEYIDSDGDGVGNNVDRDDDNDGISDEEEIRIGTNPLLPDSDNDGIADGKDDYPLDINKSIDITPPSIILKGEQNLSIPSGEEYIELGAVAIDDVDGNVSVDINGTVDVNITGSYIIYYSASDTSGNMVVVQRTVNVENNMTVEQFQFPNTQDDFVQIRVNSFGEGYFSSSQGNIVFDPDKNSSENQNVDYFKKSDDNLIIVARAKDSSIIRTWLGCDSVSTDKTECTVSLKTSHEITPIFEYKEFITVDNLYDMSNAKSVVYDWNETTQLDGNGTIVISDDNQTILDQLDQIVVGDYINYSNQKLSFLRKVNSIEKINNEYKFIAEEVALNEVIKQGTIYLDDIVLNKSILQKDKANKKIIRNAKISFSEGGSGKILGDGYDATGSANTTATFGFGMSFKNFSVDSLALDFGGGLKIGLSGFANKSGGDSKKIISKTKSTRGFIIVGPFRVFPTVKVEAKIDIDATATYENLGANATANVSANFSAGMYVSESGNIKSYGSSGGSVGSSGTIGGEGNLKISLPVSLSVGLKGYYIPLLESGKLTGEIGISSAPYIELSGKCTKCFGRGIGHFGVETKAFAKIAAGIYTNLGEISVEKEFSTPLDEASKSFEIFNEKLAGCTVEENNMGGNAPYGMFTASLSWGNAAADLKMSGGLMGDGSGTCTTYSMGSGDLTPFGVYPGHYPVNVSAGDTKYVADDELPDTVNISITTPGNDWSASAYIGSREAYNLGHVADVWVWRPDPEKAPEYIPVLYGGSGGSTWGLYGGNHGSKWEGPYSHTLPPTGISSPYYIREIEKELCTPAESCGCKPCGYGVIPYLNQANLGPISGGHYRIYKATDFGNSNIEYLYEGMTSIGDDIDTAGIIKIPVVVTGKTADTLEEAQFMKKIQGYEGDFILEISGGLDIDVNDDWKVDDAYTPLNGTIHAIISKKELLANMYKVNILTELSFQVSKDLLGATYDRYQLDNRLNDIAKKVLIEKLYPLSDTPLNRDDIVYWLPNANKNWLVKNYIDDLHPIVMKVHNGEYIGTDAQNFIYGDINFTDNKSPILGSTWFRIDENITGKYFIGKMKIISEGNSSIASYTIKESEGSDKFSIDSNGRIYLNDGETLDFEDKNYYDLFVIAENTQGMSRPVLLRLLINDISDAPTFETLKDGTIPENAKEGDYVGQVIFKQNLSPIEGYQLSGEDKDEFTIDNVGIIRVAANADLDYEKFYIKRLAVVAYNSWGNSQVQPFIIKISDIVDVPSIKPLEVHVMENSEAGTIVAELNISSPTPVDYITLLGDDNRTFNVSVDGKITVSINVNIDYETQRDYFLNVVAMNTLGLSKPVSIHIVVDNDIDVPILDSTRYHTSYNIPVATVIGKINIKDAGVSPIEKFSLSGEGSENFSIDNSGNISITHNLTQYQFGTLSFSVTAMNSVGQSLPQSLIIKVDSDSPLLGDLRTYVYENSPIGTSLGSVPIISSPTPIRQMRLSGDGSENFTIENDGDIKVAIGANLDFELRSSFDIAAYAINSAGESSASHIHINVSDMPDTIKIKGFESTIYEDVESNFLVGIVHILSLGGHTLDHFELTGEGSNNFEVLNNAQMKVSASAEFNSSQIPKYHLGLTAISTDGEKSNEVYLDISVAKSIHTIPEVENKNLEIEENTTIGTIVEKVNIISRTAMIEQAWLTGIGNENFELLSDGSIVLRQELDYEQKKSYALKMYARNSLGVSEASALNISITNVLDDEPILNDANFTVLENTATGTVIGTVEVNSTGTSAITSMAFVGIGAENFSIDVNGTVHVVGAIDYESKKVYHLRAIATNTKAESPEADVTIEVQNIAEIAPVVYAFRGYVEENATAGILVGKVQLASTGDSPVTAYELNGTKATDFNIDSNGSITVSSTAQLSEVTHKVYALQVRAKNTVGFSDYVNMSITVTYDKAVPFKPSNLELLDIGHNSITLGWRDNAQNERGFNLYVDGVLNATLDVNTTSYRVTGLTEETTYIMTVKSFNDRGESIGASIEAITDIDRSEYLKAILGQKCGVASSTFEAYFNRDTGYYSQSIYCASRGLTDADLLNFKALKSIGGYLDLNNNSLTNVDGLSNLRSVNSHLMLYSNHLTNVDGLSKLETVSGQLRLDANQLTNVNGLSSLRSVGGLFYLHNNKLTNVNGLNTLQRVGSHFYLYTNQLTNIDGLTSLTSVGGNFHVGSNQITNLDSLGNLTNVGGYVALYGNANLTDISGIENVTGSPTKFLYIDPDQYTTRADVNSSMCSTKWDLRDSNGDIPDDMNHVCTGQDPYVVSDADKLKAVLESKCNIAASTFNSYFNVDTGHYSQSISCYTNLTDEDVLNFKALKSVGGYLQIYSNTNLTNLDGLSNLKSVGSTLYLENNQLTNVDGLAKLESVGSELYLRNNKLTNVDGLNSLKTVGGNFYLENNQLTNVNGLSALTRVGGLFYLQSNQLINVDGLSSLTSVGGIFYLQSNQLTNVDGLNALTMVGNNFNVENNQLTNLDGLSNLTHVGGYVALRNNPNLTDISGAENIVGSPTKYLYITPDQYTTRADVNSSMCSTKWDLRDSNGDIPDDMNHVCTGQDPYVVSDADKLKAVLESKCNIAASTFNSYFNVDTGHYSQSIYCASRGLTDVDLLNFKALKSIGGYLYLNNNSLTNVDGLSNLRNVNSHLMLYSNQLTNVDGLSKLETVSGQLRLDSNQLTNVNGLSSLRSVGNLFYLNNNQLTNVNGLSALQSVGGDFNLHTNQLNNIDGLVSLSSISGHFHVGGNQISNLDSLIKLTNVGGYVALYNNPNLIDISGVSNIVGSDGKVLYITPNQYTTKANSSLKFCSATWDLKDINGDIDDNMTLVCSAGFALTQAEQLRSVMELKCSVSYTQFAAHFDEATGVYDTSLDCAYQELTDDDLLKFTILNEIQGSFSINDNNLTNLDGLSNLSSIGGYFYLYNNKITDISGLSSLTTVNGLFNISYNQMFNLDGLASLTTVQGIVKIYHNTNLEDISGLTNLIGVDGKKIYIDNTGYAVKADSAGSLCVSRWDLYDMTGNIADDMRTLCDGYTYVASDADRLRDVLGKRCNIDSLTFYSNFVESTGTYNGNINCTALQDAEMSGFAGLLEVNGNFAVEDSNITTVEELIRLKSVTGSLSIQNNTDLTDIHGLSNALGVDGQKLIIDDATQYDVKADETLDFCLTGWDIYTGTVNSANDMTMVCTP